MTESDILRIWNGPTNQCNKAKILKFAADLEAKRAERPADEKADEQALRIAKDMGFGLLVPQQARLIEFARRLRAESAQEPVADPDGSDCLRISKSGYSLRVGWGDDKRIVAVAPGTPEQHYRADQQVTEQWLADAERLCDGWNRAAPVAKPAEAVCEHDWRDYYTGTKITQYICAKCNMKRLATEPVAKPAVQDCVSVPREPTEVMRDAGKEAVLSTLKGTASGIAIAVWSAMLATHKEPK